MNKSSYIHLGLGERQALIRLHTQGFSNRAIGKILHRSHTTIARELVRNKHHNGDHEYYTYSIAQKKAMGRRSRARRKSPYTEDQWNRVDRLIKDDLSPEQASNLLRIQGLSHPCHEAIYQHIYKDRRCGGTLYTHLRHRCRKKRKRYRSNDSRGVLRGKTMIDDRPQHINERREHGHWEIDTVMGKGGKDCIVTMVERRTRYVWIGKLAEHTVACLNAAVIKFITSTPLPVLTITSDNGTEFHGYKGIEAATDTKFFFAHPHHAWERGTNENTNGLIRQYLPKGMPMNTITQETCNTIADRLNTRPRKILQYKTPIKAWEEVG